MGGVYQVSVPRAETVRDRGVEIPPSMGLSTALNSSPQVEAKPRLLATSCLLRARSIKSSERYSRRHRGHELHSHLLAEEPRLFFMHFWANDDAIELARGLRSRSMRPTQWGQSVS